MPEAVEEAAKVTNIEVVKKADEAVVSQDKSEEMKQSLIWDLDNQERDLRIHRAKQSNKYLPMIGAGANSAAGALSVTRALDVKQGFAIPD